MKINIKREMKNGKNKMMVRVNLKDIAKLIEAEAVRQHPILKQCNPSRYTIEHSDNEVNFSIIDFTEDSKRKRKSSDIFELVIESNMPKTIIK